MSAPGAAARTAAAKLLDDVLDGKSTITDQVGREAGPLSKLSPSERARAQSLATTTLRHLGRIDAVLDRYLRKKPPPQAMTALRLAAAELLVDGVPSHAAVDGAVRQASKGPRGAVLKGLVNAVARKVATEGADIWAATPEAGAPEWLAAPLREAFGAQALLEIEKAHARDDPSLDLTLRQPEDAEALASVLDAEILSTGSLRLTRPGRITDLEGYQDGRWWVQDAAAAMPARLFGDLSDVRALDLCAAPGGKTMQLAAAGAQVTALDISDERLKRLRENLARTGLEAEIICADARNWRPGAPFDAVLLDAPCSATGTMRRHPDLPYLRNDADLPKLIELQRLLLERAWEFVRPGGSLVYAVCSLLPLEGEAQVRAFRDRHADAAQQRPDAAGLGLDARWFDEDGGLRLRPDYWAERGGMDGFYAAVLQKRSTVA